MGGLRCEGELEGIFIVSPLPETCATGHIPLTGAVELGTVTGHQAPRHRAGTAGTRPVQSRAEATVVPQPRCK